MIIISFSACTVSKRYLHNAQPAFIPMLKEKNEGYASAYFHSNDSEENSSSGNGVNVQAGYALTKGFALLGGYSYIGHNSNYEGFNADPFESSDVKYKRSEVTLGLNFFTLSDKKKVAFNVVLGSTVGKLKINETGAFQSSPYQRRFEANEFAIFLQPGLNLYPASIFSLGIAPKLSYISYTKDNTNYTTDELRQFRLADLSSFMASELGFKLAFGPESLPVTFDLQINAMVNAPDHIYTRSTSYAIGMTYKFENNRKRN